MSKLTTYLDHEIALRPSDHLFLVTGPLFEGDARHSFPSMADAKVEIDNRARLDQNQKAAEKMVSLACIAADGSPCTIRGIHRSRAILLGPPPDRSDSPMDVYPSTPEISALLADLNKHRGEVARLEKALEPYEISSRRGYGRTTLAGYDKLIEELLAEHAEKLAAAAALGKPTKTT